MIGHSKENKISHQNNNVNVLSANSMQLQKHANINESSGQIQLLSSISNSPLMIAQRKTLQRIFGKTIQKVGPEEEELLQGKFINVSQRIDGPKEEELLQGKFDKVSQLVGGPEEEELIQGKFKKVSQLMGGPEEEELLQGKFVNSNISLNPAIQKKVNKTGLPDNLKSGVENLSGMSLDHVKVHYGSDKPAQLNALAYAQGSDIHVASGQEKHLPHEAWHVVQQMQGRVQPTIEVEGVAVNDNVGLETEADIMGAKALS